MSESERRRGAVPIHFLGISQIISYGLLFYVFAQIAAPLAVHFGTSKATILLGVSFALLLGAPAAPGIGWLVDRFGALRILAGGLAIGGFGIAGIGLIGDLRWFAFCMALIGIGSAAAQYEVAFAAAVQLDDPNARRAISMITFYGGVASSITWILVAPLIQWLEVTEVTAVLAIPLLVTSGLAVQYARRYQPNSRHPSDAHVASRFRWGDLNPTERHALVRLGIAGSAESLVFAATSLMWITWFTVQFEDPALAVLLASLYGPFQVVGRLLEMRFGAYFDARLTGLVALLAIPLSLGLAMIPHESIAVLAMILFGMGHGVLSITFGFVVSLFFEPHVYGRAKGWLAAPKAIAAAAGPLFAGVIFTAEPRWFLPATCLVVVLGLIAFVGVIRLPTRLSFRPNNPYETTDHA